MPSNRSTATLLLALLLAPAAQAQLESVALAERNPLPDPTAPHFTDLPPEQTGIDFLNAYDDPAMWGPLYREFTLGAVGAGLATGDFDQDGLPDIYAVSKTGPNKLYRQTAPFQFEDVTDSAGVAGSEAWATGATAVDINNDGWLDLYLCNFNAPNQLFVNQGDGSFTEEAEAYGLAIVDASVMAAFADFDRDGHLDLYLQTNILDYNQSFKGRPDFLFRNNGDGSFTDVTGEAGIWGISQGHSATWWDYDHDGWPDIYVANDFENSDRLYRNNGDGTFTDVLADTIPHTSYFSMGSDLGDVNNDGLTEFFVGDMAATTHEKDKRGMAEMGRGIWENERVESLFPMYMRNAFYLNNGTPRFNEIAYLNQLDASDWTWAVRFADLDNDGWNDLYITNGNIRNFMEADLLDKQNVAASLIARIRVYKNAPPFKERNLAFRNQGELRFENVSSNWGLDHLGISFGASLVDLDRDGDLDLVVNSFEENLRVYRNNSQQNGLLIRLQGVSSNAYGIGATLRLQSSAGTQVRQLTLARGVLSSDEPLVHFGLGSDDAAKSLTVEWPSGHRQTFETLAAGQLHTITEPAGPASPKPAEPEPNPRTENAQFAEVSAAIGLEHTHQENYFNELTGELLLPRRLSKQGPGLAWADADGDGTEELIVSGAAGHPTTAFFFHDGAFHPRSDVSFLSNRDSETLGVFTSPAFTYLANGGVEGAYQDQIRLPDGPVASPVDSSAATVVAADFDGDGDLDLFVAGRSVPGKYPETPSSYLLENRDGAFVDVTDEKAPGLRHVGMVTSAIWSDANNNGRPDLLLTLDWGSVTLFENTGNDLRDVTEGSGFETYLGWWNSVAAADFNSDGLMDYAVGNLGLNTKYLASPERPTQIFYGDLDGSGKMHILEAQYEDGDDKLYPVRSYGKLRYAFPSLRDKFSSYAEFAKATVPEIFPYERLQAAERLHANTLASGVFLNQGDGTFAFHELPRLAQLAPIYGIAAHDFDGDGHADLYLAQNSFSPEPTTGRFNGGLSLLLLGQGDGSFQPVSTSDSGLLVPGDAKALVTGDFNQDGWADFIVAQNSGPLLAFQNRGVAGRHSFSLGLQYHADNPHAYGARVTLRRADGSQSHAELNSHSGYLSQSQPKLFFGYTEENIPTEIQVRWPDGQETRHPFTPGQPHIQLERLSHTQTRIR